MKYNGHQVKVVGIGISRSLIEYTKLFTRLPKRSVYGVNAQSGRQFHVFTVDLEPESDQEREELKQRVDELVNRR